MNITKDQLWPQILLAFKTDSNISDLSFENNLKPLRAADLTFDDNGMGTLTLIAPSEAVQSYFKDNLASECMKFGFSIAQTFIDLEVLVEDPKATHNNSQAFANVSSSPFLNEQKPKQNVPDFLRTSPLNQSFTFDTFVSGSSNQDTVALAKNVAENPGKKYNPLFLYGGVGLGKTHLMHAIGNYVLDHNPNYIIKYLTTEDFTNAFTNSLRHQDAIHQFKEEFRNVDLLLIDDIQFLAGKEKIQEEFFNTFNAIEREGKQIVLTSDRTPSEISDIQERLLSRFNAGISWPVNKPDLPTRVAILRNKADKSPDIEIPQEVLEYIAEHVSNNVRELEGAFSKLEALIRFENAEPNTELANKAISSITTTVQQTVTVDRIIDKVCVFYMLQKEDLIGKSRKKELTSPRHLAMYLTRNLTSLSLPKIGEAFGGRDHATVVHAIDKIAESMKTPNSDVVKAIEMLTAEIKDFNK